MHSTSTGIVFLNLLTFSHLSPTRLLSGERKGTGLNGTPGGGITQWRAAQGKRWQKVDGDLGWGGITVLGREGDPRPADTMTLSSPKHLGSITLSHASFHGVSGKQNSHAA